MPLASNPSADKEDLTICQPASTLLSKSPKNSNYETSDVLAVWLLALYSHPYKYFNLAREIFDLSNKLGGKPEWFKTMQCSKLRILDLQEEQA